MRDTLQSYLEEERHSCFKVESYPHCMMSIIVVTVWNCHKMIVLYNCYTIVANLLQVCHQQSQSLTIIKNSISLIQSNELKN